MSKGLFRLKKQKSQERREAEKRRSRTAKKQKSREAKKQGKQRSKEAGKAEKQKSRNLGEADKQRNRETEIQDKKQNGEKKNLKKKLLSLLSSFPFFLHFLTVIGFSFGNFLAPRYAKSLLTLRLLREELSCRLLKRLSRLPHSRTYHDPFLVSRCCGFTFFLYNTQKEEG